MKVRSMKFEVRSIFVCLMLTLVSCNKDYSSPELEKHFTEAQIKDLNKINDFFISEILKSENQNFLIAFDNFFNECRTKGIDAIYSTMKLEDFDKVLNSISKSTMDEIWVVSSGVIKENRTKFNRLAPKYNGKYQRFLKDIGKENEIVKKYSDRMIATGDYNPGLFDESLINSYKKIDYGSEQIQIILAIHYFSVIYVYLNIENRL
ncbi:hypothetical protein [Winogradskyella ouciana]|uniref:Lipoprotein n=1 Tax=Winogradskyella ouciana TaxID=2608631 RepID=A0A7K1GEM0_9FLAO|nr:hypothetical protein [Winogradskyella ouciana]MTE27495.1 hypothetical protein [Winogradskyella ouciana]